jgi:hypothetical protein
MREKGTARSRFPLAGVSACTVVDDLGASTGEVGAMVSLESEFCRTFFSALTFLVFLTTLLSASLSLEDESFEESLEEPLEEELEELASAISASESDELLLLLVLLLLDELVLAAFVTLAFLCFGSSSAEESDEESESLDELEDEEGALRLRLVLATTKGAGFSFSESLEESDEEEESLDELESDVSGALRLRDAAGATMTLMGCTISASLSSESELEDEEELDESESDESASLSSESGRAVSSGVLTTLIDSASLSLESLESESESSLSLLDELLLLSSSPSESSSFAFGISDWFFCHLLKVFLIEGCSSRNLPTRSMEGLATEGRGLFVVGLDIEAFLLLRVFSFLLVVILIVVVVEQLCLLDLLSWTSRWRKKVLVAWTELRDEPRQTRATRGRRGMGTGMGMGACDITVPSTAPTTITITRHSCATPETRLPALDQIKNLRHLHYTSLDHNLPLPSPPHYSDDSLELHQAHRPRSVHHHENLDAWKTHSELSKYAHCKTGGKELGSTAIVHLEVVGDRHTPWILAFAKVAPGYPAALNPGSDLPSDLHRTVYCLLHLHWHLRSLAR